MNDVILVNERDKAIGTMDKMKAHELGVLHRAFSIFLFNDNGELLLQKRNDSKYHSGGLWTNTCCSHPKPSDILKEGALKRLNEEMGIAADIKFVFSFIYKAEFDNGLIENEFDHVFLGSFNGIPNINSDEVSDWKYMSLQSIKNEIELSPELFTEWFKIALPKLEIYLSENGKSNFQ
jgi:isopentenyl-diphosphate delta-isomerase